MGLLWKGTHSHKKIHIRSGGEIDVKSGASLKLAGTAVTSTAAELNYVTGVTSAIQTQVNAQVAKALFDAYTILMATTDNTPVALTVAEQALVGRKTGGAIAALAGADALLAMGIVPTLAKINLLAQGVAADYKIARGTVTPASATETVVTGLATVVAVVASLKGAPTLTHLLVAGDVGNQAGAPAAGSIYIKSYKPTAAADVTPIAATTPWGAVDWIAVGA